MSRGSLQPERYARIMSVPKESDAGQEHRSAKQTSLDLSDFLLRLCHDLRAPLRAVRAHAELLRKDVQTPAEPAAERLDFVIAGARGIELLADGLANYALALRIEKSEFQAVQMDVLIRLVLAKLGAEMRAARAELTYDAMPRVMGNPDRLSQLWEHLLLNALRHRGGEAPRIHLSSERRGGEWLFSVRDNGPGIEKNHLERIFKPFERLRGKESPGPGLGLAISREIVERHGGKIWAESTPGAGSTFWFTLPAEPG